MIESKNEASRNLEKALQALEQAKQRVANEKKKQNEKKRKAENHHKSIFKEPFFLSCPFYGVYFTLDLPVTPVVNPLPVHTPVQPCGASFLLFLCHTQIYSLCILPPDLVIFLKL